MRTKSVFLTVLVGAVFAVWGAAAQKGLNDIHCAAQLAQVAVGGGNLSGYVLHSLVRYDDPTRAGGEMNGLHIEINVPIPNKLPGFDTLSNALDNSFVVKFNHGEANRYATCYVHASRALGFWGDLNYAMRLEDDNGSITWHGGVCDVDLYTDGVQAGVPVMYEGDTVSIYTVVDGNMIEVSSGAVAPY